MLPHEAAILDEQVAAQQRVISEAEDRQPEDEWALLRGIVEQTKHEAERAEMAAEASARQSLQEAQARVRRDFVRELATKLGITVSEDRVVFEYDEQVNLTFHMPRARPQVEFGSFVFSYRRPNENNWHDLAYLVIAIECARGCNQPLWVQVDTKQELVNAIEHPHQHAFGCLVKYDADGERITDDNGLPLPPRPAPVPQPTPDEIAAQAAERYRQLVQLRREMEFKRPIEKAAAIKRLIDSQQAKSATAAKEMSHEDPDFAQFCQTLTDTVIAEMEARETLFVARKNAGISGAGASSASDEEESA